MYFTTYIFDLAYERGEQKCAPFFLEIYQRPRGAGHRRACTPHEKRIAIRPASRLAVDSQDDLIALRRLHDAIC